MAMVSAYQPQREARRAACTLTGLAAPARTDPHSAPASSAMSQSNSACARMSAGSAASVA